MIVEHIPAANVPRRLRRLLDDELLLLAPARVLKRRAKKGVNQRAEDARRRAKQDERPLRRNLIGADS